MAITRQSDIRKGSRKHSNCRKGDIDKIIIGGGRDKEEQVTVRHETVPQKKASSLWSWHKEFVAEWSETLYVQEIQKIQKRGE